MLITEPQQLIFRACHRGIGQLYEQLGLFSFSFIGHILAQVKNCHNWVHVLNFLVTFLSLTTNIEL